MQSASPLRPPRRLRGRERRARKRYLPPPIRCRVLAPGLEGDVEVLDLSPRGVCLVLAGGVDPGTVLRLRLSNQAQLCAHEVTMRVAHSRNRADGLHLIGGGFEEGLPGDIVLSLLG